MISTSPAYRSIWTYLNQTPHALRTVSARGVRTRYLAAGDPAHPALILLHGTAGSLENFCANYAELSEHFYVVGIDMLGCGYTDKPDYDYHIVDYAHHVIDVMDALNIGRAALIGVSLGSWVAARLAVDHPTRVSAVVALAPAGIIMDAAEEAAFAADVRKRRSAAATEPTWDTVSTAMGRLMLDQADLIDDLIAVRLAIYQQEEMRAAMPHLLAFTHGGNALTTREWESLSQPLLVIASVDAPNMFLDNAYAIAQLAPHAELREMTGCDHWPQFEQPHRFHELTLSFLERHRYGIIGAATAP